MDKILFNPEFGRGFSFLCLHAETVYYSLCTLCNKIRRPGSGAGMA